MGQSFAGKSALVTGASSGIGRAIALELGRQGMALWLVGRSQEELDKTAQMVTEAGCPKAQCVSLDLRERGPLAALIASIGEQHDHFFGMINNAGVMHPDPIMSGRMDLWEAMFDINVLAPLEASHAAINVMRAQGKPGHIINISSLAGKFDAGGVYGASKVALDMISRSLRKELEQDDIRVTSIVPGGFATNLGRDFAPEAMQVLAASAASKGIDLSGPDGAKLFGDPAKIAETVTFVLNQPIDLNLQEIVIRPSISLEM